MAGKVGILALQGAVDPHLKKLEKLGVSPLRVLRKEQLSEVSGIILPGGESTAIAHLIRTQNLWEPLKDFMKTHPTWGICAGAILLAQRVTHPEQESFELMSIEVERNAYGRQKESFSARAQSALPEWNSLETIFIRAPRIRAVWGNVKTLVTHKEEPILVEEGHWMASTFHPELAESLAIHEYFVGKCY